ncbi:hypothetical protein ACWD7C_21770 [Streptomyces sp. NPDC005134]|uniref:hypothetical protein n=1 Tax=unclassified Streptomyces TaxID=2593676 RepID=UPI0033B5F4CA
MVSEKEVDRSRRLSGGPSAHTDDLRDAAYEMYRALGLQRAGVRAVALRCERPARGSPADRRRRAQLAAADAIDRQR